MSCQIIRGKIVAHLDGVLGPEETAECREHLATCLHCQKERELLERSWELLGLLPAIEISTDFRAKFWEKVRRQEQQTWSWIGLPRLVPAMTGMLGMWAAGIGLGSYFFLSRPQVPLEPRHPIKEWTQSSEPASLGTLYHKRISLEAR